MSLDSFLLEILEDPIDHGSLLYFESQSVLYNPRRHVAYEVRGAIPVMLPDEARAVSDAEHAEFMADSTAVSTGGAS